VQCWVLHSAELVCQRDISLFNREILYTHIPKRELLKIKAIREGTRMAKVGQTYFRTNYIFLYIIREFKEER
jgi:hypothetical protein